MDAGDGDPRAEQEAHAEADRVPAEHLPAVERAEGEHVEAGQQPVDRHAEVADGRERRGQEEQREEQRGER